MYERANIFSAKSETVEWGNVLKLVRLAWNDSYLSVPTLAITSASSRCMHRLTIKLAAHFPYLTMIKHELTVPESDTRASSRSFFLFLFSAPDSCCLFEAIFEKLACCQSSSGHSVRKVKHIYCHTSLV